MPKSQDKTRTSVYRREPREDDETYAPTQSQSSQRGQQTMSSTQIDKSLAQLSSDERNRIVNNIVRYLLVADQKKVPIKKSDIVKNAMKEHGRAFAPLMKEASDKLLAVFGIQAVPDDTTKSYMLVNTIDNVYDQQHQIWPPEDHARLGLVMVILSVIFMKGNVIDDETLFDMLRRLGIDTENRDDTFGDVRHLVTNLFVRQGYLVMEREHGDPPRHSFRWGPRAKLETRKTEALNFICEVFGTTKERWSTQLRDIELTEPSDDAEETD